MKIETKYNLGDHVYVIYENRGEVCIYDDYIQEIAVNKDRTVYYYLDKCGNDIPENELIPYSEKDKLINKIDTILKEYVKNNEAV